ncbi:MAG: aspartate kinase [Bacteroidetes bacterium]|nr:aspartate kinase [Bacteroidota bacterium]MBU1581009.1 aspartate kinase [Bacteroidota bacterium]MBU2465264.1 aspartate kinase [Bacteroidota bacterium]MBU2557553.1 aspartate kinase [Bacteroidota bacterium]
MSRKVYKFGGASVKNAAAVRNLYQILMRYPNQKIILVFSAMGKTTNAIEQLLKASRNDQVEVKASLFAMLKSFHFDIAEALFASSEIEPLRAELNTIFNQLDADLDKKHLDYDKHYDTTVSCGELLSTTIISHFLNSQQLSVKTIDARQLILTDNRFRAANVDWEKSSARINEAVSLNESTILLITQGFIGATSTGETTTLGREGSDFTAAIIAYCLGAAEVTIWKDVPGLLNADPKRLAHSEKIDHISYAEAIELAYYGATVIHPKTIKPLQNGKICLRVQSFLHPDLPPSLIDHIEEPAVTVPSFIIKDQQILMSISARDFSFMNEHILHRLLGVFDETRIHINVMQTSALSLSVCFDEDELKLKSLKHKLEAAFSMRYNSHLTLFTIRHYTRNLADKLTHHHEVLLEQRSRTTLQLVVKSLNIQLIEEAMKTP